MLHVFDPRRPLLRDPCQMGDQLITLPERSGMHQQVVERGPYNLVIEVFSRQGLITDYNGLQLVVRYRCSENGRPTYSGISRYNAL